jgi:hypothetical protein
MQRMLTHINFRPVNGAGERVTPTGLQEFRKSHEFRAPCCLCACQAIGGGYTESAVYIAEEGPNFGKYVAGCASRQCGYLGKSCLQCVWAGIPDYCLPAYQVCIENMYEKAGLLMRKYPIRCMAFCAISLLVLHISCTFSC